MGEKKNNRKMELKPNGTKKRRQIIRLNNAKKEAPKKTEKATKKCIQIAKEKCQKCNSNSTKRENKTLSDKK